jgi:hypothetical protein
VTILNEELDSLNSFVALDPAEVDALPWEEFPGHPGLFQKMLFRHHSIAVSLLHFSYGTVGHGEPHYAAHHHIWVTAGSATIAGKRVTPGTYLHIPPGTPHPTTEVSAEGMTMFYMYRPTGPEVPTS